MILTARIAGESDRSAIAAFDCGDAPHVRRLADYVHHRALDQALLFAQPAEDHRLLLIENDDLRLVAIASHERGYLLEVEGEPAAGTHIRILLIVDYLRGTNAADGRSLFRSVLDVVFADIDARNRPPRVEMVVEKDNAKMLSICRSLDGHIESPMLSGDSVFLVTI